MKPLDMTSIPETAEPTEKIYVQDDVDEQLLPVFFEEAEDLCPKIAMGLRKWREHPQDEQQAKMLKRLLHTLKGSARMAGGMRIGEVVHEMEDRVFAVAATPDRPEYWDALENDSDRIAELLEEMRLNNIKSSDTMGAEPQWRAVNPPGQAGEGRMLKINRGRTLHDNLLRVRSEVVDLLVKEAGEISLSGSRIESGMRTLEKGVQEIAGNIAYLRTQIRELESLSGNQLPVHVSPSIEGGKSSESGTPDHAVRLQELTQFMNKSLHDMQTVQQSLLQNIHETGTAILSQAIAGRKLQEGLANIRLVPFSSISERLYRVVRKTAKALNKRANLELIGAGTELDRSVLEKMTAPFEHLLRNAIVHGLEEEHVRRRAGKNPVGEICLKLHQENNELVFELSDDGAGLDYEVLRKKALDKGLLQSGEMLSNDQLAQTIFVSGISTAPAVTEMAGRGVGMDVVCSEITALGGHIDVDSIKGEGTQFTICLPLTQDAVVS